MIGVAVVADVVGVVVARQELAAALLRGYCANPMEAKELGTTDPEEYLLGEIEREQTAAKQSADVVQSAVARLKIVDRKIALVRP